MRPLDHIFVTAFHRLVMSHKLCCPEHGYSAEQQSKLLKGFARFSLLMQFWQQIHQCDVEEPASGKRQERCLQIAHV